MTKFEFNDTEKKVSVVIHKEQITLQEVIVEFQDFLEDAGYDLDGKMIKLVSK